MQKSQSALLQIAGEKSLVFKGFGVIGKSFRTATWFAVEHEHRHVKTSVNFITHPKEKPSKQQPAYITRYGPKGFVVKGSRVLGSLAILPGLFLHWKVSRAEDITPESLELFLLLNPPLDILVIGTGDRVVRLDESVHQVMRRRGIALEVQDTANACATHNFLLDEGRITGAALIPPTHLQAKERWTSYNKGD